MFRKLVFAAASSFILTTGATAWAGEDVCVRDWTKPEGRFDPCARGFPGYVRAARSERGAGAACVKTYTDSNCKRSPEEFDHIRSVDGSIRCTIDFHQPPVSVKCATNPDLYNWVPAVWPD